MHTQTLLSLALLPGALCATQQAFAAFAASEPRTTLPRVQLPTSLPFHDIDIDPLDRHPSQEPDRSLLKVGSDHALSSDLQLCNNLTLHRVLEAFPDATAADAAVTLTLCIGMVNFFNSGVGGGGYALFADGGKSGGYPPGGNDSRAHLFLDFREKAPLAANASMFAAEHESKIGGLSIAVPGELRGLHELYVRRGSGTVSWAQLLEPVVELGYRGWEVDEALAATLKLYEPIFTCPDVSADWAFVLAEDEETHGPRVKQRGEWIARPGLAAMLDELARNGTAEPFYDPQGWMVRSMVDTVERYGGVVTPRDFAQFDVGVEQPLQRKLRRGFQYAPDNDVTVLGAGGSSSGPALLAALGLMDRFPNAEGGDYAPRETYYLVEGMKWLASARSRLGDAANATALRYVLSRGWVENAYRKVVRGVSPGGDTFSTNTSWQYYEPEYEINDPHGTTHLSIVDRFGNAVALTSTVNLLFGSLVHDPLTGVIFNNEMDDFAQLNRSNTFNLSASLHNLIAPGKRPLSSMCPTVVLNELGQVDMVLGASGGSRIATAVFQALVRTYWYHMPLLETVAYPRIHHQLLPAEVEAESLEMLGRDTVGALRGMGHAVVQHAPKSVVNAVRRVRGEWHAVSDYWRKRGVSAASPAPSEASGRGKQAMRA
ncbi:gamma-glutamyltransferase [Maudiozyma humilis]|uniref:Glutathione hydrolase n=1 Tax=Maudiozyma humilis TaxID=51915 RepID=A0AAV5RVK8_MAUHU|nr:gamma-glutamyltransferase [Kazachstania humilis]